jgi:hypothetical protein
MSTATRYWKLVKLDSAGRSRTQELPEVKQFFVSQFPDVTDPVPHSPVQQSLMAIARPEDAGAGKFEAELSLRCFISKQIEQTCVQLEMQFGEMHGVKRSELFSLVLDDDGRPWKREGQYRSVARQILETFDPQRASLSTWTIRLVKHHRELNQFLLECGVYLLSDWAILNDTTARKLQRVCGGSLTSIEVEQAIALLDAYHGVYRRDRLVARQSGVKGSCPQPTDGQLEEMAGLLGSTGKTVLRQLKALADRLRADRIATRSGKIQTVSIHGSGDEDSREMDIAAPEGESADDRAAAAFIAVYREAFSQALVQAIKEAIGARVEKLGPTKAKPYLKALRLFHCDGMSMTAIAAEVGLEKQFQVTRLMKLKELREEVQHRMITLLKRYVAEQASKFVSIGQLEALDGQIEAALAEQVQTLVDEDAAQAQSPKGYGKGSRFARSICGVVNPLV